MEPTRLAQQQDTDLEKNKRSQGIQPKQATAQDDSAFVVRFEDGDPDNPKNFHPYFKAWLTFEMGMLALAGSLGSSIIAPAEATIAEDLNISIEATVLTVALFVLGTFDQKASWHATLTSSLRLRDWPPGLGTYRGGIWSKMVNVTCGFCSRSFQYWDGDE